MSRDFDQEPPVNPYAPVSAEPPLATASSQAEAIRQEHLSHEASIKSIGVLYLLAAVFLVPIGGWLLIMGLFGLSGNDMAADSPATLIGIGIFELALGLLQGYTGLALRQLKSWARHVAILFSGIGLLGFPIGTLISAYFLYLLLSRKGVYIFSDEYQQIVAATPHMKYKTSMVVWVLLLLLIGLLAVGMVSVVVGR